MNEKYKLDDSIQKVNQINIEIKDDIITMMNNGNGIDVVKHPEYNVWIPELVFGHLRTSTNYNKDEIEVYLISNQIDINSFEDDSKEEIEKFDDDYEAESSSIEWSLFDEKEKNNISEVESQESELEENEIDDIIDNEDSFNNESDENHLFESVVEIESKMNSSEIDTTTIEAVDKSQKDDLQDPFNSSVSDFQKQRSAERRLRMKEFNYKFNKSKIDDIENEPAYKRRGIKLENKNYSEDNEISRTSITLDENDDMKIRKNNPKARKSFRARHRCATAKDIFSARYWSCKKW